MSTEFTDWFDKHDNELIDMECEDIAREAFYAGMKAAQQSAEKDAPMTLTDMPRPWSEGDMKRPNKQICISCKKNEAVESPALIYDGLCKACKSKFYNIT